MIINGTKAAAEVRRNVRGTVIEHLDKYDRAPCLAIITCSDDDASKVYVGRKVKACEEVGITVIRKVFDESAITLDITAYIRALNKSKDVDGILLQLPLRSGIDEQKCLEAIDPKKDVDGLTPTNQGHVLLGTKGHRPCTPLGVLTLLDMHGIETKGRDVCIVGRSSLVGRPLAAMLSAKGKDATVTLLHSKSGNLEEHLKRADIIVTATGQPRYLKADMVASGATIVDVGICRDEQGRLCGDADFADITSKVVVSITPVPGGVGPMTVATLLSNTVDAWLKYGPRTDDEFGYIRLIEGMSKEECLQYVKDHKMIDEFGNVVPPYEWRSTIDDDFPQL